jgi:hypothetical protein
VNANNKQQRNVKNPIICRLPMVLDAGREVPRAFIGCLFLTDESSQQQDTTFVV